MCLINIDINIILFATKERYNIMDLKIIKVEYQNKAGASESLFCLAWK